MRTPGHAVLNVALFARHGSPALVAATVAGAVLPDLPIVWLYFQEKLRGTPTEEIWRVHYQKRSWSNLIHGMHSLPIAAAGLAVGALIREPVVAAFFASALLHALCDIPVHGVDAHRHFLPFSQRRFVSPFSYWEVRRHARPVTLVEWALAAAAGVALAASWGWTPATVSGLLLLNVGYAAGFTRLFVAPEPVP
ncbi:MAG TPA: hypothetical protein VFA20_35410 [Myxococcaceae bacterium]|nr:hypothetical protein [Myxococcaceae bacterium]